MKHRLVAGMLVSVVSGCIGGPSGSPSQDPIANGLCQVAPDARMIPADLRAAAEAAELGNVKDQQAAADAAAVRADHVNAVVRSVATGAADRSLLLRLESVGLYGNQGAIFFRSGRLTIKEIATFRATAVVMEDTVAQLGNDYSRVGLGHCWNR